MSKKKWTPSFNTTLCLAYVVTDIAIFLALYYVAHLPISLASFISVLVGFTCAFLAAAYRNRAKNFNTTIHLVFLGPVGLVGAVTSVFLIEIFAYLGAGAIVAKLLTIPPVVVIQYFTHKNMSLDSFSTYVRSFHVRNLNPSEFIRSHPYVLCLLPMFIVLAFYCTNIFTMPVGFDEGYNLQVSHNLAAQRLYASNGAAFDGTNTLFDPYISTGPTLLVPIAIMFKLFGTGVWQYRVVTGVVFAAFIALIIMSIIKVGKRSQANPYLTYLMASLTVTLILTTGGANSDGSLAFFSATGEVLGLVFLLLAALTYHKYAFWAAFLVGLAALTKIIFLLAAPVLLVGVFIYGFGREKGYRRLIPLARGGLGVAIPLVSFELYRFASFHFNLAAYKLNLKEFIAFFKVAGSGADPATLNIAHLLHDKVTFAAHLSPQFATRTLRWIVLAGVLYLVVVLLYWIYKSRVLLRFKPLTRDPVLLFICATAVIWFAWWIILSNSGLIRHIMPGFILLFITMPGIVLHTYRWLWPRKFIRVGFALPCLMLLAIGASTIIHNRPGSYTLSDQQREVSSVQNFYKGREIYHVGWWQNPEVQFLLNRHSTQYQLGAEPRFVLLSSLNQRINPVDYNTNLTLCTSTISLGPNYTACYIGGK